MLNQIRNLLSKSNPGQPIIVRDEGTSISSVTKPSYFKYYETLGVVNRAVNLIVDAAAKVRFNVGDSYEGVIKGVRAATLEDLLNTKMNPFLNNDSLLRMFYLDLMIDGNSFIYYDGLNLYHLPAHRVSIESDTDTYIQGFKLQELFYEFDEVIFTRDNASRSVYRGYSRLQSVQKDLERLTNMKNFQDKFFENGAVPSLVLKHPSSLSDKIKVRLIEGWLAGYTPNTGGRRPLILDGGMELDRVSNVSFKELDFENSITNQETAILQALGVPPVLLQGGNNANIRPNQRLFYLETVMPLVSKLAASLSHYFGYEITPKYEDVLSMQPDLNDLASYNSTLVNGGIITPNEAREQLGKDASSETHMDEIRIPKNITGSAIDPSQGGRPPDGETD